jgi:hypothetical protein
LKERISVPESKWDGAALVATVCQFHEIMNLYKRGLIFATFLGCSLSAAFLAASISTDSWVYADVKRVTNPYESDGHVFFGLFKGKRELNVGYGWRTYPVSGTVPVGSILYRYTSSDLNQAATRFTFLVKLFSVWQLSVKTSTIRNIMSTEDSLGLFRKLLMQLI